MLSIGDNWVSIIYKLINYIKVNLLFLNKKNFNFF